MEGPLKLPENLAASSCSHKPPTMSSDGLWRIGWTKFLQHPMPLLELQLFVVFLLHYLLRFLHKHLKLPWLVINGVVGMILGHILRSNKGLSELVLHEEAENVITTLTSVGFALFMFLTGVKMDPSMVQKSGKQAWTLGILSLLFPLLFAGPLSTILESKYDADKVALQFFFFTQSLTPFPVITCLLIDLKILNSELGCLASSSALISFLLSNFLMATFIIARLFKETSISVGIKTMFVSGIYVASMVVLVRPMLFWIIKATPKGKPIRESYVICLAALAILSAVISDFVGLEYMFGPFILGLVVPDGPPLGSTLADRLETVVSGMMVPLFMTYGGYRTNLSHRFNWGLVLGLCGLVVLTVMGKIVAGIVTARSCNIPYKDACTLSIIMSAKGVVDMCLYITCNDKKQMENSFLSVVSMSVLVTATVVPFLVRNLYNPSRKYAGYQKRNILHAEKNAELKVLSCVFRQDDALATIKLLEAYSPSREKPLSVYVLHLVELLGRTTPLLIDHQLGQKVSSHSSSSSLSTQHIIDVFSYFKHQNPRSVNVQVFTAVSPNLFMHDDICSFAFDKMASLILLPFHRKWGTKGKMILDNTVLRTINCQVLDKAPCSVGILVDRRKISSSSSRISPKSTYRVGMLFLGGDDDREALVLCKRMARCPNIHLTVIRLLMPEDVCEDRWERMLDVETLKEVKMHNAQAGNVVYAEERVTEGPETATIVRSMESKFDLIIVGRRHKADAFTSGLEEWSEFPELGVIGDLLASSDIKSAVSALVVQQQLQCDSK